MSTEKEPRTSRVNSTALVTKSQRDKFVSKRMRNQLDKVAQSYGMKKFYDSRFFAKALQKLMSDPETTMKFIEYDQD